jgi:hypothetical protein
LSENKNPQGNIVRGGDKRMNEVKKLYINQKATEYLENKGTVSLSDLYSELKKEYRSWLYHRIKTTYMANQHDIDSIFDDAVLSVLKDIEVKGGDFVKLFQLRLTSRYNTFLRKLIKRRENEEYILSDKPQGDDDSAKVEVASEYSTEEEVIEKLTAKQKDDQRQLIDFLVRGENERTTAIVQAFLTTDLKTPTAIGKYLGLDHKQVTRALKSLAGKFSTKQFGDYNDYLIAL